MVRKVLLAFAGLFAGLILSAQNHKITLQLQDASNGEPVGFATVSVTPAKGQAKYTLSGSDGKAVLEKGSRPMRPWASSRWSRTSRCWMPPR